jgi:hypothetical protein
MERNLGAARLKAEAALQEEDNVAMHIDLFAAQQRADQCNRFANRAWRLARHNAEFGETGYASERSSPTSSSGGIFADRHSQTERSRSARLAR